MSLGLGLGLCLDLDVGRVDLQIAGWTRPQRSTREAAASNTTNADRKNKLCLYCYRPTTPISAAQQGQQNQGSARYRIAPVARRVARPPVRDRDT